MRATPKWESPLLLLLPLLLLGLGLLGTGTDAISSYGASFISNPGIYAYSVENQQEQEQEQEQNDIKFAATNANANGNPNSNSNLNRNYYYTSDPNQSPNLNSNVNPTPALATPPATQPAPQTGCTLDRLAVYKVVLHTYWTRELFPKHYPDWRPTAQWTKTLGESSFNIFKIWNKFWDSVTNLGIFLKKLYIVWGLKSVKPKP